MNNRKNWMGYRADQLIPRLRSLCDDLTALDRGEPIQLDVEPVFIEDWAMLRRAVPCLTGNMEGHPHIDDGSFGLSTEVYYLDHDLKMARTLSRWYRLGKPLDGQPSKTLTEALLKL